MPVSASVTLLVSSSIAPLTTSANRPKVMRYRGKAMKRATGLMIELTSARTSPTTSRLAIIARVVGAPGTLIPDSSFTASHNPAAFPIVRAKRSMAPSWQAHLCESREAVFAGGPVRRAPRRSDGGPVRRVVGGPTARTQVPMARPRIQ